MGNPDLFFACALWILYALVTLRLCVSAVNYYLRLLHPVPSLLTVLAAGAFVALAARGLPPLGRLAHLLVIEAGMQFSISAFNDYFDRQVDAGRPEKPVAAGVISPRAAWAVGLAF